ncbi:hypothetical protein [Arthrobacter antibioticus]|uniref:hypothetical protein n=1 Tax=Arthrobacter sp. H35-MC1 TaxID=3046203 RepID=UPI0024BABB18|nr:hypothetical protein [Arthrobacter sp. H35-MC1]MDJ0317116.1 hypothetical protein [Arthrobacter sp. H35-MC1]
MTQGNNPLSAEEARALLARADGISSTAINNTGWPTAMIFNSLAIFGSLLMIGLHIVAHTGYGAALISMSVGFWAVFSSLTWTFMQRTTKAGYSKRFLSSIAIYMGLYVVALLIGTLVFPHGSLAYYITAAVVLAAAGLAGAFRELRA